MRAVGRHMTRGVTDLKSCPVVNKDCRKCGRRGHFTIVSRGGSLLKVAAICADDTPERVFCINSCGSQIYGLVVWDSSLLFTQTVIHTHPKFVYALI